MTVGKESGVSTIARRVINTLTDVEHNAIRGKARTRLSSLKKMLGILLADNGWSSRRQRSNESKVRLIDGGVGAWAWSRARCVPKSSVRYTNDDVVTGEVSGFFHDTTVAILAYFFSPIDFSPNRKKEKGNVLR